MGKEMKKERETGRRGKEREGREEEKIGKGQGKQIGRISKERGKEVAKSEEDEERRGGQENNTYFKRY